MLLLLLASLGLGQARLTRAHFMGCINPAMKALKARSATYKPGPFCKKLFMFMTDSALKTVAGQIFLAKTPATAKKLLMMQTGNLMHSGKAVRGFSRRQLATCARRAHMGPTKLKACSSVASKVLNFFVTKIDAGKLFAYLEPRKMICVNLAIKGKFPGRCSSTIKRVMKFFLGKTFAGKVLMARTGRQIRRILSAQKGHLIHYGIAYKGIPKALQMRCAMDAKIGVYERRCWPMYEEYMNWLMSSASGAVLKGTY